MPQNCTILCPADEPERVIALVRKLVGGRGRVALAGKPVDWTSITINSPEASLVLNRRVFRENGDEFSKMLNGMWVYFDSVKTERKEIKAHVQRRIEEHALAVGVVAEPEFVEEAGHYDCIFGLAAALDAIIWNGNGVLNAEGQMLLDSDGNCALPA
jgi:hypothetical protein